MNVADELEGIARLLDVAEDNLDRALHLIEDAFDAVSNARSCAALFQPRGV